MSKIIQIMHPYDYTRKKGNIAWNCGGHKRKLIKNEISYINDGVLYNNKRCYFWGEWEPESECKKENGYFVHKINYPSNIICKTTESCQGGCNGLNKPLNTDPYVSGDYFIYSNCLQKRYTALRQLKKDDIIIFGSRYGGKFVLDTLFVVDKEMKPDEMFSDCFEKATYRFIKTDNFKIYKAKMYNPKNPNDIYSFFPCYNEPFERPVVDLKHIRNIKQGVCYLHNQEPNLESQDVWKDIVNIIIKSGFNLGVYAKEPME